MSVFETEGVATCIGCGCDDNHACTKDGSPCFWLRLDREAGTGVCSSCAVFVGAWDARQKKHPPETTSVALPHCEFCKHLDLEKKKYCCAAFPDGIPDAILCGKTDHTLPYDGDRGIRFAALDEAIDMARDKRM